MNHTFWDWLSIVSGAVVIAAGIRDMFHTLFHPSSSGAISDVVSDAIWRAFLRVSRRRVSLLKLAGPFALIGVLLTWAVLQVFGWALVYWRFLPTEFLFSTGMPAGARSRFVDALYISLVTLPTLGYGDITPTTTWLRLLNPVEAFIGFALLTAGLSWVLSVYPVLRRCSSLAHRVIIAHSTPTSDTDWLSADPLLAERVLEGLVELRGDLMQFPITYYFREADPKSAFPIALALLQRTLDGQTEAQQINQHIATALGDLTDFVGPRYLGESQPARLIIAKVVAQHGWNDDIGKVL